MHFWTESFGQISFSERENFNTRNDYLNVFYMANCRADKIVRHKSLQKRDKEAHSTMLVQWNEQSYPNKIDALLQISFLQSE